MAIPSVRRALKLLPPNATTAIGSLPHTQQELALQMALQLDVPYLPQLPTGHPSELMIASALDGFPGVAHDAEGMVTLDLAEWGRQREAFGLAVEAALQSDDLARFEPSVQACRSWKPFLWEVEHRKLAFAKVQIAGPLTVRWVARTSTGQPASEVAALDQQIFRYLLAKSLAMVRALRRVGATPLLYLDEPGMYAFDARDPRHLIALQELRMLAVAMQRQGALVGVHCCSNTDWGALMGLGLDLLAIDVRLSLDALLEERRKFLAFLEGGSVLSLGIIPTDLSSTYSVVELVDAVETALRATLPPGLRFESVMSQLPLTPACGLAMRTVLDAERVFDQLKEAQKMLHRIAAVTAGDQTASVPPPARVPAGS